MNLRISAGLIAALGAASGVCLGEDSAPPAAASPQPVVIDLSTAQPAPFTADEGAGAPLSSWTVAASKAKTQSLDFDEFIHEVLNANLDYAAQRFNVDIAKAQFEASKLLSNPTLQLGGDRDLTYHNKYGTGTDGQPALLRQVETRSIGLTQTVPLGFKRHWRIRMADETYRSAAATVDDFLRNLKIDASEAFAVALATQRAVDQQRAAAGHLAELTEAQTTRFHDGDIGETDLVQTRLEELQYRDALLQAENDSEQARLALSTFLGREQGQTDFTVLGRLEQSKRQYSLAQLIDQALLQRPDLVALRHARDAAQSGVKLAKSEIIPDVDVGATYTYNGGVVDNHPVDPTPAFHQLGVTLSIPLPVFDRGQYDVRTATAQAGQAEAQLQSAELKAEVAIRSADSQYQLALERVNAFKDELLKSTDKVLEAKRYSYKRGASTLLELLDAERSANEVQQSYQQALADQAKALLELERATGVGEMSFETSLP